MADHIQGAHPRIQAVSHYRTAISVTTILGYSAMAGIVGGGGLGAVAMNYGLYRYDDQIMFITIVIIVVIVQIFQEIGMMTAKKLDKRLK